MRSAAVLVRARALESASDISGVSDTDLCRMIALSIAGVMLMVSVMILPWMSRDVMASVKDCDSLTDLAKEVNLVTDSEKTGFSFAVRVSVSILPRASVKAGFSAMDLI